MRYTNEILYRIPTYKKSIQPTLAPAPPPLNIGNTPYVKKVFIFTVMLPIASLSKIIKKKKKKKKERKKFNDIISQALK